MTTALERAVDSLSDPDVSIADALRRLLVVSRRIGADELSVWLKSELDGYDIQQNLPEYRDGTGLPIRLRFDGYGGSSSTRTISAAELPEQLAIVMDSIKLRQPVAELAAFCEGDAAGGDPQMQLPMAWLATYRNLADEDAVPHMGMMVLNHAAVSIPKTHLRGILDRVKSAALDLALGLEDVSLEAGAAGGPTVESEPRLASTVNIHMTQIFATDSTIAMGDNAAAATGEGAIAGQAQIGDIEGLLEAARAFLADDGIVGLSVALHSDGGEPAEQTRSFLDRVRTGGYLLAGGVTTNAAYDGLLQLLAHVFPGFS